LLSSEGSDVIVPCISLDQSDLCVRERPRYRREAGSEARLEILARKATTLDIMVLARSMTI
jgi:hypothetical protein